MLETLKTLNLNLSKPTEEELYRQASKVSSLLMQQIEKKAKYSDDRANNNHPGVQYCKDMREFALSLHNVSPAGYRFIRKSFNYILPDESTLRRWMSKLDCSPGFHQQVKLCIFLVKGPINTNKLYIHALHIHIYIYISLKDISVPCPR